MYAKLAGRTGTADTEAVEFKKRYKLDVVVMPPNRPMHRVDHPDVVYKSEREKFDAVVEEIKDCHGKGQPVLVGTTSVEKSERVSKLLKKDGVKHNVLNAINHEAEANIIAQAGRHAQVTIATNMAGRGTDILLGGNPEFLARAEMENEWIRRAGTVQGGGQTEQRYEDTLRTLRERYDEEVQRASGQYEQGLATLQERRGDRPLRARGAPQPIRVGARRLGRGRGAHRRDGARARRATRAVRARPLGDGAGAPREGRRHRQRRARRNPRVLPHVRGRLRRSRAAAPGDADAVRGSRAGGGGALRGRPGDVRGGRRGAPRA